MSPDGPRLPAFFRLAAFERIDSTNEEAKRRAVAGAPDGTLVWALEQTAGRGRRGRSWASPPGNLYVSLLLRPDCAIEAAAQLSFVTAVALGEALDALLPPGPEVRFKWPNDVLIDGAKASGILMEATAGSGSAVEWVVIGVGVNVAHAPTDAGYPATCLHAAGAREATVTAVLEKLAMALQAWLERWQRRGFAPVREQWLRYARGVGEAVEVRLQRETVHGQFTALDDSGALLLALPGGATRSITAGDVFFAGRNS